MELKYGRKTTSVEALPEKMLGSYEAFLLAQWLRGELGYQDEAVVDVLASLENDVSELLLDTWFATYSLPGEADQ